MESGARTRLAAWLSDHLGAEVALEDVSPLGGGAIQENLALTGTAGGAALSLVLRRDAPAIIPESRPRAEEFAILEAAHAARVTVPRPVGHCEDAAIIGGAFSVMERVEGVALGPKVVKDRTLGGDREALVRRLGAELAAIHATRADGLPFLADAPPYDARRAVAAPREGLDALGALRPGLEWAMAEAERTRPVPAGTVLLHRDFRTGNVMLDAKGPTAILDWEFAGMGDPMADLGWFCAECWRFSRPDLEAGGLGSRTAFYEGYEVASGRDVDDAAVRWWERIAHIRWAVIALQQEERHRSGREPSLELMLTGRIADALEHAALDPP